MSAEVCPRCAAIRLASLDVALDTTYIDIRTAVLVCKGVDGTDGGGFDGLSDGGAKRARVTDCWFTAHTRRQPPLAVAISIILQRAIVPD